VRLARGVGLTAFYRRPPLARRFASQVHGMGVGYGDVHGRVRRRRDWAGGDMVSAAWPPHTRHVGHGDGAWMAVRRKGRVHGARTGGPRPGSACEPSEPRRGRRASGAPRAKTKSAEPALTGLFSKNLNCSGPRGNKESCRSLDPLQFLQRVDGLFLNQLCTNRMPSWLFSRRL
jgi:hypothetical protein